MNKTTDALIWELFGAKIKSMDRAYGGDINDAYVLELTNGERVFMKSNRNVKRDFFETEAAGLDAMAKTETIGTPRVLGLGRDGDRQFLLLEMIEPGRKISDFWETFGRELAALHGADTEDFVKGGKFGFLMDNYIGSTPQTNSPKDGWIEFFRDCRLLPQFERAKRYFGPEEKKRIETLLNNLDKFLIEPEYPSLLHGDLWSGNFMTDRDGKARLIDPAVYVGHREADIAMTELFGGFHGKFYNAYREAAPMEPGYEDRRDLYNLYHLLNHLNLFGSGYLPSVLRIVKKYT